MKLNFYKRIISLACFLAPFLVSAAGETNGNTTTDLVIKRVYDSQNHLTEILYPDGKKVEYMYDVKGNRVQMNDSSGTTYYTYDENNRLSRVQIPNIGNVSYSYDKNGNVLKVLYPSRYKILYEYDENNLLQSVIDSSGKTFFFYDPSTKALAKTIASNGVSTEYVYKNNRVSEIIHKKSDGSIIANLRYEFDGDQLAQEIFSTPTSTLTKKYAYNSNNLIKKIEYSNGHFEKFFYNSVGLCSSKTTPTQKILYKYDSSQRLKKSGDTEFFYDENDNLIKKTSPGRVVEYSYDIENRLIQYRDNENTVNYLYNGDGCRIGKIVNGAKTFFAEDTLSPIPGILIKVSERKDFLGRLYHIFIGEEQKKYTYFTYAKDRLNRLEDENSFVYLYDKNKNVIALADAFEKVKNLSLYDSSGNILEKNSELSDDFNYIAQQYDAETNLIYTGSNYYDPQEGIYLVGGKTNMQEQKPMVAQAPAATSPATSIKPVEKAKSETTTTAASLPTAKPAEISKPVVTTALIETKSTTKPAVATEAKPTATAPSFPTSIDNKVVEMPTPIVTTVPPITETKPATKPEVAKEIKPVEIAKPVETPKPAIVTPVVETKPATKPEVAKEVKPVEIAKPVETPKPAIVTPVVETKPTTKPEVAKEIKPVEISKPVETLKPAIVAPVVEKKPTTKPEVAKEVKPVEIAKPVETLKPAIVAPVVEIKPVTKPKVATEVKTEEISQSTEEAKPVIKQNIVAEEPSELPPEKEYAKIFADSINNIIGVTFDERNNQLLFFGNKDKNLPELDIGGLVTLLEFLQRGVPLQLSLAKNKQNSMDFSGQEEFFTSSIGNVFAEALILVKSLELGKSLTTGKDFAVKTSHFESLYEKCMKARYRGTLVHKTSLSIKEVSHIQNPRNTTLLFDNVEMDLQSNAILNNCMTDNNCTAQFNSFFLSNYTDLAKEFPCLQKLKNISKLLTIAKWMQEKSISLDIWQPHNSYSKVHKLALNSERKDIWTKERAPLPKEEKEWNKKHNIKTKVLETYTFFLQSSGNIKYELSHKNHFISFDSSLNDIERVILLTPLENEIKGTCSLPHRENISIVAIPVSVD